MKARSDYLQTLLSVEKNLNDFLYSTDERYIDNLVQTCNKTLQEAQSLAAWDWTHGIGLYGIYKMYQFTRDEKYLDLLEDWFENRIQIGLPEKNVNTVAPLLPMAFLHEIRPRPVYESIMREWSEWIMHDMKRTQEGGIQHRHAELENNEELWDDTLLMTVLFLTKASKIFHREDYMSEAVYQLLVHAKYLVDSSTGLWYHGWTFLERNHFAGALWGRGNCWITVFIPEFLEIADLPEGDPNRRFAVELLRSQAAALKKYQSPSGMWHTLIPDDTSYLEASGTAGFCFGLLKGIRKGYLDDSYQPCAHLALNALLDNINECGELMNVSYGTNVGRSLQYYKEIPLKKMHYGQALAMLALIEGLIET